MKYFAASFRLRAGPVATGPHFVIYVIFVVKFLFVFNS